MAEMGKCCPHVDVQHRPGCRICGDGHAFEEVNDAGRAHDERSDPRGNRNAESSRSKRQKGPKLPS
jgi:hypothetical protein